MGLPSATDLQYFLEVSRTLNVTRAAERIGVSQPTLTQSIRKLEGTVGSQLLVRSRVGVRLTRSGQRLAAKASGLLEAWSSLQREALADDHELQGRFRVGCHPSVARYVLPEFFRALAQRAPRIEVELEHDLSRRITESVIAYRVDLGFVINPVRHPDLVLKRILTDSVTVFESPRRQGRWLFGDPEIHQTNWVLKRISNASLDFAAFVPTKSLEVIGSLVASGAGYGILPARVAACEHGAGLRPVDPKIPAFPDQLFLVWRKDAMASCAGKALTEIGQRLEIPL